MKLEDVGLTFFVGPAVPRAQRPDRTDFHMYFDGQHICTVKTYVWGVVLSFVVGRPISYVRQLPQPSGSIGRDPDEVLRILHSLMVGRGLPPGVPADMLTELGALNASGAGAG